MKFELAVNFPIYNEGNSISEILDEWINIIEKMGINYCLILSEDGSKDNTKEILKSKIKSNDRLINNITEERRGYGGAVLSGVELADSKYVLCVDSDGQCDPQDFIEFWKKKTFLDENNNSIVFGYRNPRADTLLRKIYSFSFRVLHFLLFPNLIKDPSCPYVLTKKKTFLELADLLTYTKEGFWWGFIAACSKRKNKILQLPVNHRVRFSGDTQVYNLKKIPGIAIRNAIGLFKIRLSK